MATATGDGTGAGRHHDNEELEEGPYGLRGKHTPPLGSMLGAYAILFGALIVVPLVLFLLIRFVLL